MTYKRKPKACERCSMTLVTSVQHDRRSWMTVQHCVVRSDLFPEMCIDCAKREQELCLLHENIRRLKAWARREGTRRRIAESLATECDKYEPTRPAHHRWALIWEMTGEHKELRKLVERLMPHWGSTVSVIDPEMGGRAE